jgi:hypothetical protein
MKIIQLENETSIQNVLTCTYKNVCGRNSFETALRVSLKFCTCRIVKHNVQLIVLFQIIDSTYFIRII